MAGDQAPGDASRKMFACEWWEVAMLLRLRQLAGENVDEVTIDLKRRCIVGKTSRRVEELDGRVTGDG